MDPFTHAVSHAFREAKHLPPKGKGKSAILAFIIGVAFGPFGVGLYLRSWMDFWVPMGFVIIGSFLTVGLAAPIFWMLSGLWGAVRVNIANASSSLDRASED